VRPRVISSPSLIRVSLACFFLAGCGGAKRKQTASLLIDSGYVATDDGIRLFYRTVGDGPLTVVIPVALYLDPALRPLAAPERRLVFYDLRARGRSDAGDRSQVTLDREVADLEAVRRGLGIDTMVLVGWSGLGMELAVYTMRHPKRVSRLVQVTPVAARDLPYNEVAFRTRAERTDSAALAALEARHQRGDFGADPAAYCRALWEVTGPANFADPGHMADVPDACRFPNEYPDSLNLLFEALLGSFDGYDWRDAVATLRIPRLVIQGAEDAFSLEGTREWVPPESNACLLVVERAGHFPFLERPDVFFPAVDGFLRGNWPPEGRGRPCYSALSARFESARAARIAGEALAA
jgi:pimeloyl-ACP methyl ester carboxylesterase